MLGFSVENHRVPHEETVRLAKAAGFDAVAFNWKEGVDLTAGIRTAKALEMPILYLHAPQGAYYSLWLDRQPPMLELLLQALEDCNAFGIGLFVMHTCSDWAGIEPVWELGFENYKTVTDRAAQYGIRVALENTARTIYLRKLMDFYKDDPNVGFCWDCGHEQCYTPQEPALEPYADRLFAVHLCDNLGLTDPEGIPGSHDDLHLLPYDGIANWDRQICRLKQARPLEALCLETKMLSKPGKQKVDLYSQMPAEAFIRKAYNAGQKLICAYF